MNKATTHETKRLLLTPTTTKDAPFILELFNTPEWKENIGDRNIHTVEDAEEFIKNKIQPQYERLGFSNFTVIRKSDGAKIGSCGLYDREGVEGVDIGFAFLPAFFGKGYAYESASKIMEVGLNQFNLNVISGITLPTNIASQKLLERIGLKHIKNITLPEETEELMLYRYIKNS